MIIALRQTDGRSFPLKIDTKRPPRPRGSWTSPANTVAMDTSTKTAHPTTQTAPVTKVKDILAKLPESVTTSLKDLCPKPTPFNPTDVFEATIDLIDRDAENVVKVQKGIAWLTGKLDDSASRQRIKDTFISAVQYAISLMEVECEDFTYHRAPHPLEFAQDLFENFYGDSRPIMTSSRSSRGLDEHAASLGGVLKADSKQTADITREQKTVKLLAILMAVFHDVEQKSGAPKNEEKSFELFENYFLASLAETFLSQKGSEKERAEAADIKEGLTYFADRAIVSGTWLGLNFPAKSHKSVAILTEQVRQGLAEAIQEHAATFVKKGAALPEFPVCPYLDAVLAISKFDVARAANERTAEGYADFINGMKDMSSRREHLNPRVKALRTYLNTGDDGSGKFQFGLERSAKMFLPNEDPDESRKETIQRAAFSIIAGQMLRMVAEPTQNFQWAIFENVGSNGTDDPRLMFRSYWNEIRDLVLRMRTPRAGDPTHKTFDQKMDEILNRNFPLKSGENMSLADFVLYHVNKDFKGFWSCMDVSEATDAAKTIFGYTDAESTAVLGEELNGFSKMVSRTLEESFESPVDLAAPSVRTEIYNQTDGQELKRHRAKIVLLASVLQSGVQYMSSGQFTPHTLHDLAGHWFDNVLK